MIKDRPKFILKCGRNDFLATAANRIGLLFLFTASILLIASCIKEPDLDKLKEPDWSPEFAVPLVSSRLTMNDLIENSDGYLSTDSTTGLISLVYETSLNSPDVSKLLKIPDQAFTSEQTFSIAKFTKEDSIIVNWGDTFEFSFSKGERLDSLQVTGLLEIGFVSNFNKTATIELTLPFLRKNGMPYVLNLNHIYDGNLPVVLKRTIDLNEQGIYLNSDGNTQNLGKPEFRLKSSLDNFVNQSPYHISVDVKFKSLGLKSAFGYLAQYSYDVSDSVSIDLFDHDFGGDIQISDVFLNLKVANSFGMPVKVDFLNIKALSAKNPPYQVIINDIPNPVNILAPGISQAGQSVNTNININSKDLVNAINMKPDKIIYSIRGSTNPDTTTKNNFILNNSSVNVVAGIEMPLHLAINKLALQDTMEFDVSNIDELESCLIRLYNTNAFPFDVKLQVYLLDASNIVIDSLIQGNSYFIASATVSGPPEYKVTQPAISRIDINFDKVRVGKLKLTKNIVIRGELSTYNQGYIKLYKDNYLDVDIGIKAKVNP